MTPTKTPTKTPGTVRSYTIGFVLSLALTIEAYLLITGNTFSSPALVSLVLVLAIIQLLVQLFFFLHVDRAAKFPWNIIVLLFTGVVVGIVVFGSLWIMQNLNYNMSPHKLSPAQIDKSVEQDEGITPKTSGQQ